jgi:hypothetical protein
VPRGRWSRPRQELPPGRHGREASHTARRERNDVKGVRTRCYSPFQGGVVSAGSGGRVLGRVSKVGVSGEMLPAWDEET